tara:strand:- start:1501 stop:2706 length:1206 start_codon:yes stop_codon:yes gene_type:complete
MSLINNNKIFVLAGESSGDLIGAYIMEGLKEKNNQLLFIGIGGSRMKTEGLNSIYEMNEFNIIGFVNTISNLKKLNKYLNRIVDFILKEKPKAVITIDTKGFSLALAKKLKNNFYTTEYKCPLIHFVPPTIWAYGKSRIKKWANLHDGLFCLFKNEEEFFRKFNIKCSYVGNPIVEKFLKNKNNIDQFNDDKFYQNNKVINCLLLPGSRDSELKYILPEFISLIKNSNKKLSNINWIIPTTKLKYNNVISKIKEFNISSNVRVLVLEDNYETLKNADLAVACSGTITLELVLFKVPTIAVYKTDFFSALIGRLLVNFENVLLPNFLLGKEIIPFLFQEKANHVQISKLLIEYIESIDKKKSDFKKYSKMILNSLNYNNQNTLNFSKNSSKEINRIINNYVY